MRKMTIEEMRSINGGWKYMTWCGKGYNNLFGFLWHTITCRGKH